MEIALYQIDAFASRPFEGNPAAVCPLDAWLPDDVLQAIAAENNLSETAFVVQKGDRWDLRWFTPAVEVDLCGHATLASAFAIRRFLDRDADTVVFDSRSGELVVRADGDRLVLDFPTRAGAPAEAPAGLVDALGREPLEVIEAPYWMAVYASEADVRALDPDLAALERIEKPVIATAPGDEVDFVSRFFAPSYGIAEDPVTGSAHCTLTPYWSKKLGKSRLLARQVSARGGELTCEDRGERTLVGGRATLYLEGRVLLSDLSGPSA